MTEHVFRHKHLHLFNTFLDSNRDGVLTWDDFAHIAEKFTLIQGSGTTDKQLLSRWSAIVEGWWHGVREAADSNSDNEVNHEEWVSFFEKIRKTAKSFDELPKYVKDCVQLFFIGQDYNRDGLFGKEDYIKYMSNFGCDMSRTEECYRSLLIAEDKKVGGISAKRFDELLFKYCTTNDPRCQANHIHGPYDSKTHEQLSGEHLARIKRR